MVQRSARPRKQNALDAHSGLLAVVVCGSGCCRGGCAMDSSVIIATYNRARLLRQTLASLGTQVLPAGLDWEIVVVDNNSKDDTREVVDSCARQSGIPIR